MEKKKSYPARRIDDFPNRIIDVLNLATWNIYTMSKSDFFDRAERQSFLIKGYVIEIARRGGGVFSFSCRKEKQVKTEYYDAPNAMCIEKQLRKCGLWSEDSPIYDFIYSPEATIKNDTFGLGRSNATTDRGKSHCKSWRRK